MLVLFLKVDKLTTLIKYHLYYLDLKIEVLIPKFYPRTTFI